MDEKATATFHKYNVDAVVANILDTRYQVVYIFSRRRQGADGDYKVVLEKVERTGDTPRLDTAIVRTLAKLHEAAIQKAVHKADAATDN